LSNSVEIVLVPEEGFSQIGESDLHENGVDVPLDRINPEILHNLIAEFVTREWEELGAGSHTLEEKIEQVLLQLQRGKAKVVFDLTTNTCNIIVKQ